MKFCICKALKFKNIIKKISAGILCVATMVSLAACTPKKQDETPEGDTGQVLPEQTDLTHTAVVERTEVLGAGGYGAIFDAQIDPYNPSVFAARCDMGSVYVSNNKGDSWVRHDIKGTLYALKFDPSSEGVLWAAGSGLYKSVDHGESFNMVFPDPQTVTSEGNRYENVNHWIYSTGDYVPQYQLHSIAIDRSSGGNRVFVAQKLGDAIRIHKSENGKDFVRFTDIPYANHIKLEYDEGKGELVAVTEKDITGIGADGSVSYRLDIKVELQKNATLSFDSVYVPATKKTTFAFSTADDKPHATTALYITDDLQDRVKYVNIIDELVNTPLAEIKSGSDSHESGYASYEYNEAINKEYVKHEFKWGIENVHIVRPDCVYFYQEDKVPYHDKEGNAVGGTRNVCGYCKYEAGAFKWIYGGPHRFPNTLKNYSWQDADVSGYGFNMSALPENDDAFLFSTIGSVYYTEDGENVYQKHCTLTEKRTIKIKNEQGVESEITATPAATNGLDVQNTYKTVVDPFDSNHLLMACTDVGLLQSFDGGTSWMRCLTCWNGEKTERISANLSNTCYDVEFDREKRGVAYALWSGRHDQPYSPIASDLDKYGAFATSYDGGTSWTFTDIREGGKGIPYRMSIDYSGAERTIYVATMGYGFFVSNNSGKTFREMNQGITPSYYLGKDKPAIFGNKIICGKGGVFAITASKAYADKPDPEDPTKKVFERALYKWNQVKGEFEEIALNKNTACVRDIEYSEVDGCLYIAAMGDSNYYNMNTYGGGVYRYKDGELSCILDDGKNIWGVALDGTGRLYAVAYRGEVYRFINDNTEAELLMGNMFHTLKDIAFGVNDNVLYVATMGGGTYRLTLKTVKR